MTRDHKLDFSEFKPSPHTTFRPERDRSRSPKRRRGESLRPENSWEDESVRHDGRRRRGRAKPRIENGFRERSPRRRDATPRGAYSKSHQKRKNQGNEVETKGLSDKIHSLRRLLAKATDMPADIRQEKERELQGYVTDQQRHQANREKNAVTSRYHFVRFMERKKADRLVKRLEKNLDAVMMAKDSTAVPRNPMGADAGDIMNGSNGHWVLSDAERLALQKEDYKRRLHDAKVDLNYTIFAPLDQKYISLYPSISKEPKARKDNGGEAGEDHDAAAKDDESGIFRNDTGQKPPLWYEVEKAMENSTLEALRDGQVLRGGNDADQGLTFRSMAESANGKRVTGIESGSVDEDEESEDDFFEGGVRV